MLLFWRKSKQKMGGGKIWGGVSSFMEKYLILFGG
jgi:hypothetical protein